MDAGSVAPFDSARHRGPMPFVALREYWVSAPETQKDKRKKLIARGVKCLIISDLIRDVDRLVPHLKHCAACGAVILLLAN